jgi:hypothetical protein
MTAKFLQSGKPFYPLSISTAGKGGVWIGFNYIQKPPFDSDERRSELLRRINLIDGVSLLDPDSGRKIPMSLLSNEAQLAKLLSAMDWFADELRRG